MHSPSVPVIDIAPFLEGSAAGKREVAEQVGHACEEIGFFTIVGHRVPTALTGRTYDVSKAFFDLPIPEKMKVRRALEQSYGYIPVEDESLSYSLGQEAPPDLKESFSAARIDVPDEEYYRCAHFAPTLWPDRPAGFRTAWAEYYRVMEKLAADLMRVFALALRLPEAYFDDKIDKHCSVLRVLHYPEQPREPLPGQLRAGAHSDYGTLTILRAEAAPGGLQVRTRRGEWFDVEIPPDSFIVNIGDMVMRWTNDRWISTLHRVVNPPRDEALGRSRLSLVFFHMPNYDAVLSCLESCREPGTSPKYPPITAGDYKLMKVRKQTLAPAR
jgi:isopenicillin N synthase-like dioxygenase